MDGENQKKVPYFPHQTGMFRDPKITYLRKRISPHAYGFYCYLLERMCEEDGIKILWNNKTLFIFSDEYGIGEEMANSLVNAFVDEDLFQLGQDNFLRCRSLVDKHLKRLFEKRTRDREWKAKNRAKKKETKNVVDDTLTNRKVVGNDTKPNRHSGFEYSIVEKSKVKKSKEENIYIGEEFNFFDWFWNQWSKKFPGTRQNERTNSLLLKYGDDVQTLIIGHLPKYLAIEYPIQPTPLSYMKNQKWTNPILEKKPKKKTVPERNYDFDPNNPQEGF